MIDQNNEIWFVVNKAIAGYGSRPLFYLDLDSIVEGENPVASFVRDLGLEFLAGQSLTSSDKVTGWPSIVRRQFTANWATQYGENHLVNFTSGGSILTLGGQIAPGLSSPKIKYDLNGDFFVKGGASRIDLVAPATGTTEYIYTKLPDGGYYVAIHPARSSSRTRRAAWRPPNWIPATSSLVLEGEVPLEEPIATYTGWAQALDAQQPSNWTNSENALGTPDADYATGAWASAYDLFVENIVVTGSGTITKVEAIAEVEVPALYPMQDDTLQFEIGSGFASKTYDVPVADVIAAVGNRVLISVDVTDFLLAWNWNIFDAEVGEIDYMGLRTKTVDANDGSFIQAYGVGFRVTSGGAQSFEDAVKLAEPTTSTTRTSTVDGEEVTTTTIVTDDASLLFVGAIDTSSLGLNNSPNLNRGKKPKKGGDLQLRAAVYGPEGYDQWFLPSGVVAANYTLVGGGNGNNGHGNNVDGVDVSNPGQGGGGPNGEIDPSGGFDDEIHNLTDPATNPAPANNMHNATEGAVLSWTAAPGATSHNVYFGTVSPPPFVGNQTGTTFTPANLTPNTKYFWRVDEVNAYGPRTGSVWNFTVVETSVLASDGFESGTLAENQWSAGASSSIGSGSAFSGSLGVELKKTTWIEKSLSTAGLVNIRLSYARKTANYDSGEALTVQWWDGTAWQLVESTQNTTYSSVDWLLPAGAYKNANFKIRFSTNASHNNETADVDEISVTGVPE